LIGESDEHGPGGAGDMKLRRGAHRMHLEENRQSFQYGRSSGALDKHRTCGSDQGLSHVPPTNEAGAPSSTRPLFDSTR